MAEPGAEVPENFYCFARYARNEARDSPLDRGYGQRFGGEKKKKARM